MQSLKAETDKLLQTIARYESDAKDANDAKDTKRAFSNNAGVDRPPGRAKPLVPSRTVE